MSNQNRCPDCGELGEVTRAPKLRMELGFCRRCRKGWPLEGEVAEARRVIERNGTQEAQGSLRGRRRG